MTAARGIVIAAAASHSGKTTVTAGLIAALTRRGLDVAAAKCGPDYIDPRFLAAASGREAVNLDPWAMARDVVHARLARRACGADLVVIEGVMGLFDGGPGGAGSTASLAAILGLPVVLVVGAQGTAQSAAAVAEGFARMAKGFTLAGAIVNQVASDRHAALIREGFARSSVPLLGLVRRDPGVGFASRHLGLVQAEEHADLAARIARAAALVEAGCDLDAIVAKAGRVSSPPPCGEGLGEGFPASAPHAAEGKQQPLNALPGSSPAPSPSPQGGGGRLPLTERLPPLGRRIAVARDVAFGFAYPHLLADWRDGGVEIAFFSPLADEPPAADTDAIFLPGGYPELHAARLATAASFRAGMEQAAMRGALIYGECGGYMMLGETLTDAEGATHRMLGLLPVSTSFAARKLQLGYRRLEPLGDLPWATALAAHEFHYATIVAESEADRLFQATDAAGLPLGPIGLRRGQVMGSFAHVIDRAPD